MRPCIELSYGSKIQGVDSLPWIVVRSDPVLCGKVAYILDISPCHAPFVSNKEQDIVSVPVGFKEFLGEQDLNGGQGCSPAEPDLARFFHEIACSFAIWPILMKRSAQLPCTDQEIVEHRPEVGGTLHKSRSPRFITFDATTERRCQVPAHDRADGATAEGSQDHCCPKCPDLRSSRTVRATWQQAYRPNDLAAGIPWCGPGVVSTALGSVPSRFQSRAEVLSEELDDAGLVVDDEHGRSSHGDGSFGLAGPRAGACECPRVRQGSGCWPRRRRARFAC